MTRIKVLSAAFVGSIVLFMPLLLTQAQVMSPYGYSSNYYPTTSANYNYNSSYYPTNTYPVVDQYYNKSYPTNSYNNSYGNYYQPYYQQAPTCTLSITAPTGYSNSVVSGTVSWTTSNASSVYLSGVGQVNSYGSAGVTMYPGQTFVLTMSGPGGSNNCQNTYYPAQQYGYNSGYGYNQSSYNYQYGNQYQSSYYPSYSAPVYPITYAPTYAAPVYTQPVNNYNPITYMSSWWNNTMHW